MIIFADLDISEGDKIAGKPDSAKVLIYTDENHNWTAACHAMESCRLMREGHAYTTTIHHAGSGWVWLSNVKYCLDQYGEVVSLVR